MLSVLRPPADTTVSNRNHHPTGIRSEFRDITLRIPCDHLQGSMCYQQTCITERPCMEGKFAPGRSGNEKGAFVDLFPGLFYVRLRVTDIARSEGDASFCPHQPF